MQTVDRIFDVLYNGFRQRCLKKGTFFYRKESEMIETITPEVYQHVLNQQELTVHYQPIVSISKRSMIGYESLLRAYYHDNLIPPDLLFLYASETDSVHTLDSICQKMALLKYREGYHNQLLFINIETSLIEYYLNHATLIINTIDTLQIPRGKIVIEINEKRAGSNSQILDLVHVYRNAGFLIALDDVGAGHSNLNRIVLVKPDIVKIDRSVIMDIDQSYIKQEVLRSITELGQKIGAITIAEGVEAEAEVITCVGCGVDWFQGYFFSKAMDSGLIHTLDFQEKCRMIAVKYQGKAVNEMIEHQSLVKRRKELFDDLISLIEHAAYSENLMQEEEFILDFLYDARDLECVYILDKEGTQITDTLFHPDSKFRNQEMFTPMKQGDSHISKPFYIYALHNPKKTYVSVKYISLATGNYCQTISRFLSLPNQRELVLCADFIMNA